MSQLIPFNYQNHQVRTIVINKEPWFVAADVCAVLEISNPSDTVKRLDDDERTLVSIEGASNSLNVVNEPGLYSLILGSRKPEAKAFKRWITHEVIPQIRKTGIYDARIPKTLPDALRAYADAEEQRVKLLAENVELRPKAELHDTFLAADHTQSIGKLLKPWEQARLGCSASFGSKACL